MDDRVIQARRDVRASALGTLPAGAGNLAPPGRIGHAAGRREIVGQQAGEHEARAGLLGHGDMAGRRDESGEIAVADRGAGDQEGRQLHQPRGALTIAGFTLVAVAAHPEHCARQAYPVGQTVCVDPSDRRRHPSTNATAYRPGRAWGATARR